MVFAVVVLIIDSWVLIVADKRVLQTFYSECVRKGDERGDFQASYFSRVSRVFFLSCLGRSSNRCVSVRRQKTMYVVRKLIIMAAVILLRGGNNVRQGKVDYEREQNPAGPPERHKQK